MSAIEIEHYDKNGNLLFGPFVELHDYRTNTQSIWACEKSLLHGITGDDTKSPKESLRRLHLPVVIWEVLFVAVSFYAMFSLCWAMVSFTNDNMENEWWVALLYTIVFPAVLLFGIRYFASNHVSMKLVSPDTHTVWKKISYRKYEKMLAKASDKIDNTQTQERLSILDI